jgi:hypothetical protein
VTVQPVQPAPLPANWNVGVADPPNKFVVVVVTDTSGTRVLFLEPDAAVTVGNAMVAAARQARSGLVIPTPQVPLINGKS